jgi:hypothetical protein
MYRCWHLLTPPTTAWLLTSLSLALGDLAWRALWPGSYVRWRELPAALLRLAAFGPPAAWLLMGQLLEDHGAPSASSSGSGGAAAGAAAHLTRLLFASGAMKMAANALSLRVRLRWGGQPAGAQ